MTTKNPITGDDIKSKPPNKAYEDGWDRIFKVDNSNPWCSRIDIIGQNGPTGLHYDELCSICGKELAKTTECAWTSCPLLFKGT